jgi:DNA-binding transcriptional LysR family regulator
VELRNLEYFLAVVEHGSLRAAAQQLGVTQPALTKAVRRLEDSFGVLLFERRARGVALTTYGSALVRHARDLRSSVRAAWDELGALRTGSAGLVRVGRAPPGRIRSSRRRSRRSGPTGPACGCRPSAAATMRSRRS